MSTGAKAGIGVGVGIAAVIAFACLILVCIRRRRAKQAHEAFGDAAARPGKEGATSGEDNEKRHVLPTWKSELSGTSARAELDGTEKGRAELSEVRSPTELDAAALHPVGRHEIPAEEQQDKATDEEVRQDGEFLDMSQPPPIPYASKPRPS